MVCFRLVLRFDLESGSTEVPRVVLHTRVLVVILGALCTFGKDVIFLRTTGTRTKDRGTRREEIITTKYY